MRRFAIACCLALVALPVSAQSPGDYLRVQRVVRSVVEQTGYEFVGLGSWISGRNYGLGSDHDLRLVLRPGTANPQQHWARARGALVEALRREFGDDAAQVLRRTNLYAPSQLMAFVETTEEALERYNQLRQVPNLGFTGNAATTRQVALAEGLYGDGAAAFTQHYESQSGRLFYRGPNGRAYVGLTDLTHLSEGVQRFSTSGLANTSRQWAAHAWEELATGRADKVAKYLERIERDLAAARRLAGAQVGTALSEQLKAMTGLLRADPGRLAEAKAACIELLKRANMEAGLLSNTATLGPIGRAYNGLLLRALDAKSKLGDLVREAYQKAGGAVNFEKMMTGLQVLMALRTTSRAVGEAGLAELIRTGGPQLAMLASLPVGLVMELTVEVTREAEAAGYEFCAASQEPWDLMAGVYTAFGREHDEPDPRRCVTLDQLVAGWFSEARLSSFVHSQCRRAAARNLGGATEQVDDKVAEQIFAKCWPVIRDAWRWQRDQMVGEFLQLAFEVRTTPLLLTYTPEPIPWEGRPVRVTVTARPADPKVWVRLERMRELMKKLCGPRAQLAVDTRWTPDGELADDTETRHFTFDREGVHPVVARMVVTPLSEQIPPPEPHRVMLPREVVGAVDVIVGEPAQPKPPGAWRYAVDAPADWKPFTADSPAPNRHVATRARTDALADEAQAAGWELVRAATSGPYKLAVYGVLVLSPTPWRYQSDPGAAPAAQTLGDVAGTTQRLEQIVQTDLFGQPPPGVRLVERGRISGVRQFALHFEPAGDSPLHAVGILVIEATPAAVTYEMETLLGATQDAYDQAKRELEALLASARVVRG